MTSGIKLLLGSALLFAGVMSEAKETKGNEKELPQLTKPEFKQLSNARPRLFCRDFSLLKQNFQLPAGKAFGERIIHDANLMLDYPVCEREMEGRRLLSISRNVLYRVNTLLVAWVVTGEDRYADRAKAEILAAGDFTDWNPSHFLDVGEMTLAVATGYDWLYDRLSPAERKKLEEAIIEKGLKPSLEQKKNWWISGTNNWTQVCHAGMLAGALAVREAEPELAFQMIDRAIRNLPKVMRVSYGADGTYPEGVMYWGYGTEFNSVLLALLDAAFGQDFGLSNLPGLQKSGDFVKHCTAPSGIVFSYADATVRGIGMSYATAYLVKRFNRPDFMDRYMQKSFDKFCQDRPKDVKKGGNRLYPLALFFIDGFGAKSAGSATPPLYYASDAESLVPIGIFRSGWDEKAVYLAMKGGAVNAPHGHMDIGSFVLEMNGMRVAEDLGMENYNKIEQLGMSLWDSKAGSDRWKIFRLGAASHNIVVIDDADQNITGRGTLAAFQPEAKEPSMTWNLAPAYGSQVKTFIRTGTLLVDHSGVAIKDQFTGLKKGSKIRWQFCTALKVASIKDNEVILDGKNGKVVLRSPAGLGSWRFVEASTLLQSYDAPADKFRMLYFEAAAPASGELEYVITIRSE